MKSLLFAAGLMVAGLAVADIGDRYIQFQERFTSLSKLARTLSTECRQNLSAGPDHPACQRMEVALIEAKRMLENDLGEFVRNPELQRAYGNDPEGVGRVRGQLLLGVAMLAHAEETKDMLGLMSDAPGEQ